MEIRDHSKLNILKDLTLHLDLDVWSKGYVGRRDAMVMVSEENKATFQNTLDDKDIRHYVHLEDVVK